MDDNDEKSNEALDNAGGKKAIVDMGDVKLDLRWN